MSGGLNLLSAALLALLATAATGPLRSAQAQAPSMPPSVSGVHPGPADVLSPSSIPRLGRVEAAEALSPSPSAPLPERADLRLEQLRRLVLAELGREPLARAEVALLVLAMPGQTPPPQQGAPRQLIAVNADAPRVPASNAKLYTSTAATEMLYGSYRFTTELSQDRSGGPLYVWGTGDPLLHHDELLALIRQLRARGLTRVHGVVVDDSYFGPGRLAPGFEQFSEASRSRPTSSALNLDGNLLRVRVSAVGQRHQPKIDVFPLSNYVKLHQQIRLGGPTRQRNISLHVDAEPEAMWLRLSGTLGRRARPFFTRRPVYDPALQVGWVVMRLLGENGVRVEGPVRRGLRPTGSRVLARLDRPFAEVLSAANSNSNNLAAETLVRAIAAHRRQTGHITRTVGDWQQGLGALHAFLREQLGIDGVKLGNGSGLHRTSTVTARSTCALLRHIYQDQDLRQRLVPTLAVAGRSGTLRRRMRHSAAQGHVYGKTGTLAGTFALSGFVMADHDPPLAFSLLVNGTSQRRARRQIDRIVTLLARYGRGLIPDPRQPLRQLLATPLVKGRQARSL